MRKLLIFDFDGTVIDGHMHSHFCSLYKSDYNSGRNDAVTEQDVESFLQSSGGIKNKEKLSCMLKSALNSENVEVAIASFTRYPKAVKLIIQKHLGLSEGQAQKIRIVGSTGKELEDVREREHTIKPFLEQRDIGKNLHIFYHTLRYKSKYYISPQEVMLVDDDEDNIKVLSNIHEHPSYLLRGQYYISEVLIDPDTVDWTQGYDDDVFTTDIGKEELRSIKFKGVFVPSKTANQSTSCDYLDEVEKFISPATMLEEVRDEPAVKKQRTNIT
ncbi:hypothetical protein [Wolbachia endosymbiont of Pentidionis agamae]|uniref:hypothetical protein n=1 Tax=Wolbachia endosymbiont of Pentidionis agamae TaxID=3110435 RepID=UPI002FD2815F